MKCSRDINLGTGGTRDLRKHKETKLHKHSENDGVGVLPLPSCFGPIRQESVIHTEVLFAYILGEHHLAFQLGDHCTKLFMLMFPEVQSYYSNICVESYCPELLENHFRSS